MVSSGPILLGQYRPLDSYLHRLDARAKLIPVLATLILALFADSAWFYVISIVLVVGALVASGVTVKTIGHSFQPIFWLVGLTALYHLIFTGHGGEELVNLLGWSITRQAATAAAFFSLRLVLFLSIAFLITLTNSPSDLADSFARLLQPLRRFRIPVNDLGLILFMAIRFIPVLYEEFTVIRYAQMTRGADFSGPLIQRVKKTSAVIIPVFVAAINRADQLAESIELRGYGKKEERTYYSTSTFAAREIVFASTATLFMIVLFAITG